MAVNIEALFAKKFENLEKQMQAQAEKYEKKLAEAEKKLEDEKVAKMNAEQLKEYEKAKEAMKAEDEKAQLLKEMEDMKAKMLELEKEKEQKAFQNKKLIEKSKHPYIAEKIESCESEQELQMLYKFTDFEKEKAMYEADNNITGSVISRQGTVSKDNIKTNVTDVNSIVSEVKAMEAEMLKRRQANYYSR